MRKLLFFVLFAFLTQSILAETNTFAPKNLSVRVDFNYQNDKKGHINRYVLNNDIQMEANSSRWIIVQEKGSSAQGNPIILLSKIEKMDSKEVTLAFLVVDAGKTPIIISKPKLVVLYGQKGQITINGRHTQIRLAVLATA